MMIQHDALKPNDIVWIGSRKFRLRYITRHGTQNTYRFQPHSEPLSPFVENDVVVLSIDRGQSVMFEVIPE